MASQTKSEPVERATPKAPATSASASARVIDADSAARDSSAPTSSIGSVVSGQSAEGDDEDVSLDELMMSDSNDGEDELEESTDVHGAGAVSAESEAAERPNEGAVAPSAFEPSASDPLEDDEAAALAAAAAEQEAAAQAAVAEAEARAAAARRTSEPPPSASRVAAPEPAPRTASSPPPPPVAGPRPGAAAALAPGGLEAPAVSAESPADAPLAVPETALDASPLAPFEAEPPRSMEVDLFARSEPEPAPVPKSPSTPPPSGALRLDAPLPSFDIPEAESARAHRNGEVAGDPKTSSRVNARPLATPLSHLSEVSEDDDDDAVTHIGLPVVSEAPSDYSELPPPAFQPVDHGVAALHGLDPDLSLADARRATTRLVPRLDPAQIAQRRASGDTNPALSAARRSSAGVGAWLSGLVRRVQSGTPQHGARRRSAWLLDTVLPPLSLVLFGSGIGAGIMLLQPDRGAKAAQQAQTIQSLAGAPAAKRPTTLAERAESGDGEALFKITNMSPGERSSALTLALERGYQAQKLNEFKEFARQLDAPSGLDDFVRAGAPARAGEAPNLTGRFLGFATSPETMLPAFAHLLGWPGSTGPDVLYAVWEKAPGGNRAASLAQQLLHSADQRAKATPALITALDLRSATSCDDYLRVLPAVQRNGDQRCSATLRALKHRDGCGDDGRQDCFACLREGTLLDDTLKAIESRPAPQL